MKVSVIIRTKNEEKTIGQLLEMLKKQTFKDFELILVDNASTDKTLEIAKKYKIDKLVHIPEGKFSHPKSLNDAIAKAKGELIVITNGHSVPVGNKWLENGIRNFEDPKVAGISGYWAGGHMPEFFKIRLVNANLSNTNSIIRKSLWEEYPFDEKFEGGEDYDWGVEMLSRGYKTIFDPKFSIFHYHVIGRDRRKLWAKFRDKAESKKRKTPLIHRFTYYLNKVIS